MQCLKRGKLAYYAFREVASLKNNFLHYVVFGLIALAGIGILSSLISNPIAFLKSILIIAIVAGILIFLIRRFAFGSFPNREANRFRRAAKRSQKKYKQKAVRKQAKVSSIKRIRPRSKSAPHLTVIEGRKGKKKNRASF